MFHSIIAEGKKEILKKMCLLIKLGILSEFLTAVVGIRLTFVDLIKETNLSVPSADLK